MSIANMKNDLADTQGSLEEDKKFLAELEQGCGTKQAEWDERQKTRSEELVALAETIKILNADDAHGPSVGVHFCRVRGSEQKSQKQM